MVLSLLSRLRERMQDTARSRGIRARQASITARASAQFSSRSPLPFHPPLILKLIWLKPASLPVSANEFRPLLCQNQHADRAAWRGGAGRAGAATMDGAAARPAHAPQLS